MTDLDMEELKRLHAIRCINPDHIDALIAEVERLRAIVKSFEDFREWVRD